MIEIYSNEKLNIIHVDMDAFYASIEENDNPTLKGKPIVVGGNSKRGIVTTASYEARKYGLHSAMPIFIAKQKCPNVIIVPTRMDRYREVSRLVFGVLSEFTNIIEPLSIDEGFLDISGINKCPLKVANSIKQRVLEETGLTMSIGISYNKFLAKIASDWNKPDGIKVINRLMVPEILFPLSVSNVHGIGPKSSKRLNDIGIYKIKDLMNLSEEFLESFFGKHGGEIYKRIRGIDDRRVTVDSRRKSIGTETTFIETTLDIDTLKIYLYEFSKEIEDSLNLKNLQAKTITLKLKDVKFKTQTKGITLSNYTYNVKEIYQTSLMLLEQVEIQEEIRLIGLSVSNLFTRKIEQLSLFDRESL